MYWYKISVRMIHSLFTFVYFYNVLEPVSEVQQIKYNEYQQHDHPNLPEIARSDYEHMTVLQRSEYE